MNKRELAELALDLGLDVDKESDILYMAVEGIMLFI